MATPKISVAAKLTAKDAKREREREIEGAEWPYLAFPEELWLNENTALIRRDAQPGSHGQPSPLLYILQFCLQQLGWKTNKFGGLTT